MSSLLKAGANPHGDGNIAIPISTAAFNNHKEIVKILLANGANPNDGILNASKRGHAQVVKILLEKGADPATRDYAGRTAKDVAKNDAIRALF